jgi:hypothetical protein
MNKKPDSAQTVSATVAVISTVIFFVWVDGVTVRESPVLSVLRGASGTTSRQLSPPSLGED